SVETLPPRLAWIFGSAVITTSASRAVMKKATDVSTSAQPADLVSRMSHLRDRAAVPSAPADCPAHLSYGGGGPRSTAEEKIFVTLRGGSGLRPFPLVPACRPALERLTQRGVIGGLDRPGPGGRGLAGAAGPVQQVRVHRMQRRVAVQLAGGQHRGQDRE